MKVRLWTLGNIGDSPQNCILPNEEQIQKLRDILSGIESHNNKDGTVDIVWGPELKLTCEEGTVDTILIPAKEENGEMLYRIERGK